MTALIIGDINLDGFIVVNTTCDGLNIDGNNKHGITAFITVLSIGIFTSLGPTQKVNN